MNTTQLEREINRILDTDWTDADLFVIDMVTSHPGRIEVWIEDRDGTQEHEIWLDPRQQQQPALRKAINSALEQSFTAAANAAADDAYTRRAEAGWRDA